MTRNVVCALLFLATLLAHPAQAAIRMEVGNQGMVLDDRELSFPEAVERSQNGVFMQTPPRPDTNIQELETLPPETLPFGIVPEVLVPWHPPQPPDGGGRPKPPPIGKVPPKGPK